MEGQDVHLSIFLTAKVEYLSLSLYPILHLTLSKITKEAARETAEGGRSASTADERPSKIAALHRRRAPFSSCLSFFFF